MLLSCNTKHIKKFIIFIIPIQHFVCPSPRYIRLWGSQYNASSRARAWKTTQDHRVRERTDKLSYHLRRWQAVSARGKSPSVGGREIAQLLLKYIIVNKKASCVLYFQRNKDLLQIYSIGLNCRKLRQDFIGAVAANQN